MFFFFFFCIHLYRVNATTVVPYSVIWRRPSYAVYDLCPIPLFNCSKIFFINSFMPNELFHLNSLGRPISSRRGVWLVFIITKF